jgi:hypothetical protein
MTKRAAAYVAAFLITKILPKKILQSFSMREKKEVKSSRAMKTGRNQIL